MTLEKLMEEIKELPVLHKDTPVMLQVKRKKAGPNGETQELIDLDDCLTLDPGSHTKIYFSLRV